MDGRAVAKGPMPAPSERREVTSQIFFLGAEVDEYEKALVRLKERIYPVCSPEPPVECGETCECTETYIGGELRTLRQRLHHLTSILNLAADCVQL